MIRTAIAAVALGMVAAVAAGAEVIKIPKVEHGQEFRPTGTFSKIEIGEVTNDATVDLTACMVDEVVIGLVDRKSTVKILARKNVTFTDKIDGESKVEVSANAEVLIKKKIDGGSTFSVITIGTFRVQEKIDGRCAFNVTCKNFEVVEKISGSCNGEVNASAKVSVKKIDDDVTIKWVNKRP